MYFTEALKAYNIHVKKHKKEEGKCHIWQDQLYVYKRYIINMNLDA